MSVPPGFHLGHRDGHGASFYIQVCHLCSNKLLDELESTWPSIISLQQNSITMALIAGQNVSDGEHFLGGRGEKKKRSLTYTPARLILLASFLFLQSTKLLPTPGPLLTLFPSPGTLPPPTTWGSHVIRQTLVQGFASSSLSIGTNPPPHPIYSLTSLFTSFITYDIASVTISLVFSLTLCSFPSSCEKVWPMRAGVFPLWFTTVSTSCTWHSTWCLVWAQLICIQCMNTWEKGQGKDPREKRLASAAGLVGLQISWHCWVPPWATSHLSGGCS